MTYDLETLRLIAWALLGLVALGMALCEGMTLGLMMLMPWITDRHALVRIATPTSLGGLSGWLVFIAVLFAAWPIAYAVALASFQPALWLISLTLMVRPLIVYFYAEFDQTPWHGHLDKLLTIGGWLPAALLGLLAGNLLKGIPFHLESDMRIAFLGDAMSLVHLFGALVAVNALCLLMLHGASYCITKSTGEVRQQAQSLQWRSGLGFLVSFALTGLWITHLEGYHVTSDILTQATSNPLAKFVKRSEGLWLDNYEHEPWLIVIPVLSFLSAIAAIWLGRIARRDWAMIASSMTVAMTLLTLGLSLFPFLLPSNLSLNSSLTIWDSSASQATLQLLLPTASIAVTLWLCIQRWTFRLFSDEIGLDIAENNVPTGEALRRSE